MENHYFNKNIKHLPCVVVSHIVDEIL